MNAVKSNEIVLLLFDISNFDSFQWIVDRAHLIHQLKKIPPSVILIGTKYDLDWKRDVEAEDAYQLAEHFKWQYVEISAADQSIADHVSRTSFLVTGKNVRQFLQRSCAKMSEKDIQKVQKWQKIFWKTAYSDFDELTG